MAYLGQVDRKASNVQVFNVTSSTSATHDIGWTPPSEQTLIVTINGVKQHTNAFSFSGSTLTLGAALVATDELEVIGINDIGNSLTPVDNSVTASKLGDDAVTTVKIQDNAVTLAKMAGGTDGNLITYDASGDPAHVATGSATHVLTSNGAGAAPTFQAAPDGGLTHASQWRLHTDFAGTASPINSNLEEVDAPVGFGVLGASMTQTSGVFKFPATGYWLVSFHVHFLGSTNSVYNKFKIETTIDNSTGPTWAVACEPSGAVGAASQEQAQTTSYIFDVTDTTECRCRFVIGPLSNSGTTTKGDTSLNETHMTFLRLADT